ncbi:MAG: ParA family protein [Pyrinomonadaceae bacterium]|nr:ParA family protein [Pyrinomonadaceae bacterium]
MKTIVIANHKGGCAKTTTALNLAIVLANQGSRVLAVDLDPQGNLSVALGTDLKELESTRCTAHRMMIDSRGDIAAYLTRARPKLDLIPSCLDHDAETLIEGQPVSRDLLLKNKLAAVRTGYDYCVIDTPPALRAPTLNALAMSDMTIIPIESSNFALVGLGQVMRMVAAVRKAHAPKMIIMALSTKYKPRQTVDKEVRAQVEATFKANMFESWIPDAAAVNQATGIGKSIYETNIASPAALSFFNLANEIRERFGNEKVGLEDLAGAESEGLNARYPQERRS